MKKKTDPRHKRRQHFIKQLFSFSFDNSQEKDPVVEELIGQLEKIDQLISQNAPEWPISQINRIDLAILRLAVYELDQTNTPPKVVIDEAVELGKEYGSNSSPKFINGVLGNVLKTIEESKPKTQQEEEDTPNQE